MPIQKRDLIPLAIVLCSWLIALLSYSSLQALVPTSWDAAGNVTHVGPKAVHAFLYPGIILLLYLLLQYLPVLDPRPKSIIRFPHLFGMKLALLSFFLALHLLFLNSVHGLFPVPMSVAIPALIAVLLFYIGAIIKEVKRNFFIGIRTPWTLSSDQVWEKTHRAGSITLRINALAFLLVIPYPGYFLAIILLPTLANVLFLAAYSFILYRRLRRR